MIEIKNLTKSYEKKIIFDNVSINLQNSHIYALVGVNGIGKSTLMNSITQAAFKDSGEIRIDSIPNSHFDSKFHFFFVPDHKDMFMNLSGFEYLSFIIQIYHCNAGQAEKRANEITHQLKLDTALDRYISSYSLGMKQKLYLTGALISNAPNLILDEPFNGLDPESCILVKKLLRAYCSTPQNMVLYSIHNLDLAAGFSDLILFIDKNRNLFFHENSQNIETLEKCFFEQCVL